MSKTYREITDYNEVTSLASDDEILLYDKSNASRRKAKMSTVLSYVASSETEDAIPYNPYLVFMTYSVPTDGTTNALTALQNLFNYLNTNNIPFRGVPGIYVLSGAGDIEVKVDADFTGMIFRVGGWDGRFHRKRRKAAVTYNEGDAVINALEASTDLTAGSSYWDGLKDRTELDNSYIKILTDQNFYQYRDTVQTRTEFTHVFNKGFVASPLLYDMTGVNITSIIVYPMEDTPTNMIGLTIDLQDNQLKTNFIKVETTHLKLQCKFIQSQFRQDSLVAQLVFLDESAYIDADLTFENSLQSGATVAYGLGGDDCYDVKLKIQGDGDGWGLTALNEFRKTIIYDSNVSRVDFHRPFFEHLKVFDSTIGDHGFTICGIGDLHIRDCTLLLRKGTYNNTAPTLILGRDDTGGFIEGDLFIDGLRVENQDTFLDLLFNRQATDPGGSYGAIGAKPTGSPMEFRFFKNINIRNIHSKSGKGQPSISIDPTRIVKNGNLRLKPCETLTIRDCNDARLNVKLNLDSLTPAYTDNNYDLAIHMANNSLHTLKIFETTNNFNVKGTFTDCRPFLGNYCDTYITAAGDYDFYSCQLHGMKFRSDNVLPATSVRAHSNTQDTGDPDTAFEYFLEAQTANFLEGELTQGDEVYIEGLLFDPPVGADFSLTGSYILKKITADALVLYNDPADPWSNIASWDNIDTAYAPNSYTEYVNVNTVSTPISAANDVRVNFNNCRFQGRNVYPISDFFLTKPDNVEVTMFGGVCDSGGTNILQNMFTRGVKFYGTKFMNSGTEYQPTTDSWQLIKPEFFNEKQLTSSLTAPHSFAANNTWEATTAQVTFDIAKTQYVYLETVLSINLGIAGNVAARVLFEGSNDGGTTWATFATYTSGYISSTGAADTGDRSIHSRKVLVNLYNYKKYRATLYLRVGVDSGTSFPLSQGDALVDDFENKLTVTYV